MIRRAFLIVVLASSLQAQEPSFALSDRGALPILLAYADARADRAAENASGIDKLNDEDVEKADAEGRLFDPARSMIAKMKRSPPWKAWFNAWPRGGDREHLDEAFPGRRCLFWWKFWIRTSPIFAPER